MIYLSGPITNENPAVQELNLHRFDMAAELLRNAGYTVFNPADLSKTAPNMTYAQYMRLDIEALLQSDGVAILPGWAESKGARLERGLACAMDVPVRPLATWIDEVADRS